jgi:Flp pilus assembly protein TadG
MTWRANALARLPGAVSNRGLRVITGSSAVGHDRRFKIFRPHARGQSLVEFAIVLPVLLVLVGGAVQFGVIFAAKNGLTQVTRDIARWAATQTYDPCNSAATATPPQPLTQAVSIASVSSLIGYSSGTWNSGNFKVWPDNTALPTSLPIGGEGVEVVWSYATGACPPSDNSTAAFVTVRVTHTVPVLLAGLQYMPGFGTCDTSGCHIALSSTSMFRMEPPPQ